jgi:hypothetical protein
VPFSLDTFSLFVTQWLKRFSITILRQHRDMESVVTLRQMAEWNVDYIARVTGIFG